MQRMGDLGGSPRVGKMIVMKTAADGYRSTSHCCGVLEQIDFAAWADRRGTFPYLEPCYSASAVI